MLGRMPRETGGKNLESKQDDRYRFNKSNRRSGDLVESLGG